MENALRVCLTGHQSNINHRRLDRPVVHHFNQQHHSLKDLTLIEIEKIHKEDANLHKQESYRIEANQTLSLNELNLDQ